MKINHHAARPASIEPLEARIAPAAVFTYTDVDGDLVTVKTSRGTVTQLAAILVRTSAGLGEQLQEIDFSANAAVFSGTDLRISARRTSAGGDGLVNVGAIDASSDDGGANLDLGFIAIRGDLGQIDAGDATTSTAAVKGLSVQSMGEFGTSTQQAGGSLGSFLNGALGSLRVAGNVRDAFINTVGGVDGKMGPVTVGGSLIGGGDPFSGGIASSGAMGLVKISGNIEGGDGQVSGGVTVGGKLAGITISGSLLGGIGNSSGQVFSTGAMGAVRIGRDIEGGGGASSGRISANGALGGITLGGSLVGGAAENSGQVFSMGAMGPVFIGGNIEGGIGTGSANISAIGSKSSTLAGITINGSVLGGAGQSSGQAFSLGAMGPVKIGGNIEGGAGRYSGAIRSASTLAWATIGGSLLGGSAESAGEIRSGGAMGPVAIAGNIEGATGPFTALVYSDSTVASVTIRGSILGGSNIFNAGIRSGGAMGPVKIAGSVEGGSGISSGFIESFSTLAGVTLGGSLVGGSAGNTGSIVSVGAMGPVKIGGDIEGGSVSSATAIVGSGFIRGSRIASLLVVGSIISGTESGGGTLIDSGAVRSGNDIGPITIKGSLIGNDSHPVLITARGQATPGATTDEAIKSLSVSGRVERADILAGYNTGETPWGVNADAQIGAVVVGDWIASNLVAGVQDDTHPARDALFGDGDDQAIAGGSGGIVSRIASILIKGTALGTVGGVDFFGFVAQQIGSFKVGASTFPLTKGPANNLAGLLIGVTDDLRVREVGL